MQSRFAGLLSVHIFAQCPRQFQADHQRYRIGFGLPSHAVSVAALAPPPGFLPNCDDGPGVGQCTACEVCSGTPGAGGWDASAGECVVQELARGDVGGAQRVARPCAPPPGVQGRSRRACVSARLSEGREVGLSASHAGLEKSGVH